MAKLSLLSNFLKVMILCGLTTACQTLDNTKPGKELSPYEEQQMRDSTFHGPKERIAPLITKTIVVDNAEHIGIEPESD